MWKLNPGINQFIYLKSTEALETFVECKKKADFLFLVSNKNVAVIQPADQQYTTAYVEEGSAVLCFVKQDKDCKPLVLKLKCSLIPASGPCLGGTCLMFKHFNAVLASPC